MRAPQVHVGSPLGNERLAALDIEFHQGGRGHGVSIPEQVHLCVSSRYFQAGALARETRQLSDTRWVTPLLFLLLLAVPIAELWVIVEVAGAVGILETLALLVLVSVAGAWLLKQQGMATWLRLRRSLERGDIPAEEVTDGALILLGGALLLTPGFLTDIVGLTLLLPPSRAVIKGSFRRFVVKWAGRRWGWAPPRRRNIEVVRVERRAPKSPEPGPPLPPKGAEGDSPHKV